MTLVIGIRLKDRVIMACDTLITVGDTGKKAGGTKLRVVNFGKLPVIVGQSGNLIHTSRFIQILSAWAKETLPTDEESVAEIISGAIRKFRDELKVDFFNCSPDDLNDKLAKEEIAGDFLFGYYLNGKASLALASIYNPTVYTSDHLFQSVGSGSVLADYLLQEHASQDMAYDFATTIAIYVVETVKKYDSGCDHKTVVASAYRNGGLGKPKMLSRTSFLDDDSIAWCVDLIEQAEQKTRAQRNEILHREFRRQDEILNEERKKFLAELPPLTKEEIESMMGDPNAPDIDLDPDDPNFTP